jgi:hypothetical protein
MGFYLLESPIWIGALLVQIKGPVHNCTQAACNAIMVGSFGLFVSYNKALTCHVT